MTIETGGNTIEVTAENSMFVYYPNELLNGLFVDLEDSYAFVSAHTPAYEDVEDAALREGVVTAIMDDVDLTRTPDVWITKSVGRIMVTAMELLLGRSDGD